MEYRKLKFFFCIVVLLFTSISILGQSKISSKNQVLLKQRNPDGWFNLLVPKKAGKVERHADVDGGFFTTNELEIDYIYWKYENTPNPFRDVSGNYSKSPMLICTGKSKTKTRRTSIDGNKAIVQTCIQSDKGKGNEFIYYVTFPKLRVYEEDALKPFGYGMFNLTVTYKNQKYLPAAEKIVRSLDFNK